MTAPRYRKLSVSGRAMLVLFAEHASMNTLLAARLTHYTRQGAQHGLRNLEALGYATRTLVGGKLVGHYEYTLTDAGRVALAAPPEPTRKAPRRRERTRPRGRCPVCSRDVVLRQDGLLRSHREPSNRTQQFPDECLGTDRRPTLILSEVA